MSNQDRKPLLPKFRAEELPQGQHYAIAAGHFGETGIVLKRIHYGFDYPTRCKGQGCPLCKEVIKKSRDKAAQRYKVNERGVICANVVIADDESLDVVMKGSRACPTSVCSPNLLSRFAQAKRRRRRCTPAVGVVIAGHASARAVAVPSVVVRRRPQRSRKAKAASLLERLLKAP